MTREEAIETLKANYPDACYEQLREAVDTAIEALKAQDTAGDTIYRKVAIDAVQGIGRLATLQDNDAVVRMSAVEYVLFNLPSAQPEITLESAIKYLHSIGWMQEHDRILTVDRDIPKKPNETTDRLWGIPNRQAVCPNCDSYLGTVHFLCEGDKRKVTYCESCGQAIDWGEWDKDE